MNLLGYVKADKNLLQARDYWKKKYEEEVLGNEQLREMMAREAFIMAYEGDKLLLEAPAKMLIDTESTIGAFKLKVAAK